MFRRQLPAFAPLSLKAIGQAGRSLLSAAHDVHAAARGYLLERYLPRDVLLTDSGTSALTVAVRAAAAAAPGTPVAIPAYACYDVATAALGAGVRFALYDVDPATLGPDWSSLNAVLRAGASAVVVVHQYGYPVDMDAVSAAARTAGAVVIEDAAQAFDARRRERRVGTLGDFGVLSFGRGKGATTGRGGALMATSPQGQELLKSLLSPPDASAGWLDLGLATALWALGRPRAFWVPAALPWLHLGETRFRSPRPARAMSRFAASLLPAAAAAADAEGVRRRANAERLRALLEDLGRWHVVPPAACADPSFLRLAVVAAKEAEVLGTPVARSLGVMRGYPSALCDLTGFGPSRANGEHEFPGARQLADQLYTFPTHRWVNERDFAQFARWADAARRRSCPQ